MKKNTLAYSLGLLLFAAIAIGVSMLVKAFVLHSIWVYYIDEDMTLGISIAIVLTAALLFGKKQDKNEKDKPPTTYWDVLKSFVWSMALWLVVLFYAWLFRGFI